MSTQLTAREQLDITAIKLNDVFFQAYNENDTQPGIATVKSPIFKQMNTNLAAYYQETYGGLGYFTSANETDSNVYDRTNVKNLLTVILEEKRKNIKMSKEYFETSDVLHPVLTQTMRDFSLVAKKSQDLAGFGLFRGGFSSVRTPDGVSWFGTHPLIKGGTQSNVFTGAGSALTPDTLNQGIKALYEQKDQAGTLGGYVAKYLLVPPSLYSLALQITKAVLVANTNNNNYNMIGQEYPLEVYQSVYLGTVAGGSDTAWFLLSMQHSVTRIVRKELEVKVVPWEFDDNNNYTIKAYYAESYFVSDYAGTVGFAGV